MNNFDAFRAITRRHFWDSYVSCLTCIAIPVFSGSSFASGDTLDVGVDPVFQAAGPTSVTAVRDGAALTVTWEAAGNSFAYVIYQSASASGPFSIVVAGVQGLSFTVDAGLPEGTFIRVTGIEPAFGETLPSPVIAV